MKARWLVLGTMLVALVAVVVVAHSPLLAVDVIEIRGASKTDVAQVVSDTGVGPGALLLWVDTGALTEAIKQQPWVSDARVDRIWPGTIDIEVIEHQPVVWIEGVLGWMLVARNGTVLERAAAPGAGLMRAALAFPDAQPGEQPIGAAWDEVVSVALVLSDDIGSTLELEMRGPEMWTVALGTEVRFGHPIDLADKGRALRAMLAEEIPGGALIDVSSPLRPAIVPIGAQLAVESQESQG
jgi:cell division protein FtsQ